MAAMPIYERPTRCKYCDRIFDFPTITKDVAERDVPTRTRICGACLAEMGANEALREARAEANRRSITSPTDRSMILVNGHRTSEASTSSSVHTTADPDSALLSSDSPEQSLPRTLAQPAHGQSEGQYLPD